MSIKRANLLATTALVAAVMTVPGFALATELDDAMTITATDATGLADTNGAGAAIGVTINSNTGAITLGADATPAIAGEGTSADPVTVTVTTSGTANGVTFAGDVSGANANDVITINSTNDNLTFQGNVTSKGGAINMGAAGDNPTLTVTFDTAFGENLTIDATIGTIDAGDTVTMAVANSEGGARTIAFSQNVGGASAATAIDTLTIGAGTTATFAGTTRADTITVSSTNTTTFVGAVTGNVNMAANGTVSSGAGITGNVDNTTGAAGAGTLALTGANAGVTGNVGATNSLLAVTAVTTGGTTAFGGNIAATTITLSGTGATTVAGNVTGNVNLSTSTSLTLAADKGITGALDNTSGGTAGAIAFGTSTANTTLVSGNVGATNAFTTLTATAGAGTTQSFGGTVAAATITLAGTGTTAFAGDVTAAAKLDLTGDGTVTIAADKKVVGNVDADGNKGTLTFGTTTTDTTLVSGTVGASNALKAVNVTTASGVAATLAGAVNATTLTSAGTGTLVLGGDLTGNLNLTGDSIATVAGGKKVVGNVDNTSGTAGVGTLTIGATGAGLTVVSGTVGATKALKAVTVDTTGGLATFAGAVNATTITATGTGGTTFTGGATATTINLNNTAGDTTFSSDVTATTTNLNADTSLIVAADKKIVGAVTTTKTDQGTLAFGTTTADTTVISGAIGTSTAKLKAVTAGAAAGKTATFGGDINATTITLTGADETAVFALGGDVNATTLAIATGGKVNVASGKNITAAVTADGANRGSLNFAGTSTVTGLVGVIGANELNAVNVNGGTVTFANNIAATNINVAAGAILKTTGALTHEGAINNSGTLNLGGTLTATAGGGTVELGTATGAAIVLGQASAYTSGVVIAASAVTVDATKAVTVTPHASFTSGTLTLVDTNTGAGTADDATKYTLVNNALTNYSVSVDANSDVILTAAQKSSAAVAASLGSTVSAADALAAGVAATTGDAVLTTAYNTALTAGGAEAKKAAEQSQPNINGAASQAVYAATRGATNAVSQRLNAARSGTQVAGLQQTGVASGDATLRSGGWVKTFGSIADQSERDGVAGYDSHTYGVTVGMDHKVTDTVRIGGALSYANTDVDGNDAGNSQTDVDSYQVAVYGSYEPGVYFVEGQLGYSFNSVDSTREITFGGLNRTAKGSYDVDQYTASVAAGLPMKSDGFTITPKAGLFYSYSNGDSYSETGAGGMNLTVDTGSTSVLEGSLGGSVAYDYKVDGGMLRPEVRAAVMYDFIGDEASATSRFAGSGATFATNGAEVAQFGGTMGVGLGYTTADGVWEVRGDYDAELRSDYVAHTGMLTGRINF